MNRYRELESFYFTIEYNRITGLSEVWHIRSLPFNEDRYTYIRSFDNEDDAIIWCENNNTNGEILV